MCQIRKRIHVWGVSSSPGYSSAEEILVIVDIFVTFKCHKCPERHLYVTKTFICHKFLSQICEKFVKIVTFKCFSSL